MAGLTISSVESLNRLSHTNSLVSSTARKLLTGSRIPNAAADSAGLAIAKSLESELQSLSQASRNVNDGVSLAQVAEGGLSNIQDQLGRLSELTVAASNGALSATQREALNTEANSIIEEVNRVANVTEFNGQKLLDGSLTNGVSVQVGSQQGNTQSVAVGDSRAAALGIATTDNLLTQGSSQAFLSTVQGAIASVSSRRSDIGAAQKRLDSAQENLRSVSASLASAHSQIADADVAAEAANFTRASILQSSGVGVLSQIASFGRSTLKLIK